MTNQGKAYMYGLVAVLLWSTVASAFKLSLRYFTPPQLLLYASVTSLIVLGAILTIQGKLGLIATCGRKCLIHSLLLGFLNPFLYYLILIKAYDLLPAQEAQPLNYTWALTLALLSIPLLGQKISFRDLLAGLICYSGVLVISTRGDILSFHFTDPLGVTLALVSTLIWALYWIFNTRSTLDPVVGLFLNFAFGTPLVLLFCLGFSTVAPSSPAGMMGAAYIGLFEMGITFVLWLTALRLSSNASRIGNLIFLSPFLSLIFIRFLVGEQILPSTLVGLGLIIAGLTLQRLGNAGTEGAQPC